MEPVETDLSGDVRDLVDRLHELAALQLNALWLLCENLPLGAEPGRGAIFSALLGRSGDLVEADLPPVGDRVAHAYFLSSMTDTQVLNQGLVGGLSAHHPAGAVAELHTAATYGDAVREVLSGRVLLLVPGSPGGLLVEARGYPKRGIQPPVLETVVRGPHEAFNEDLQTNISLLRRRLRDPRLVFEPLTLGRFSRTEVRLCYIEGLANPRIVSEARRRLAGVSATAIVDSNYIEESIGDDAYTVFPQVDFTERPDIVAIGLTEGRFAILVDGTNDALVAPVTFWSFMQAADDYYQNYYAGTFLRLLRYAFLTIAVTMPALYIALTTFHQQMIPTSLLLSLMRNNVGIPFPALVEALIMEITLEILREAGLHLPEKLGTSLSVVGALVIGEAVVSAGLVSWPVVAVVAITAIANFAIPRWTMALAIRLLRFGEMLAAAIFGLPGVLVMTTAILVHLVDLRSFGVPYLFPVAPLDADGLQDAILRMPHWTPQPRPRLLAPAWRGRVRPGRRPHPPRHAGTAGGDPRWAWRTGAR